jgi:hypothetical protein
LTIRRTFSSLLAALLLFAAVPARAQSLNGFARSLMAERDYFRAVSVYKQLAYFTADPDSAFYFLSQAGKAYRLSEHYDLAISTFADLANGRKLDSAQSRIIDLNLGLSYLGLRVPALSEQYLQEAARTDSSGIARLFLALAFAESANLQKSREQYAWIQKNISAGPAPEKAGEFTALLDQMETCPQRSPALAAIFSAILPGSGQMYCGHPVDALQAFGFVAAFSAATLAAYRYDHAFNHQYILTGISISITAIFHLANIIGAEKTAEYFNARQRDLSLDPIRQQTLGIDF